MNAQFPPDASPVPGKVYQSSWMHIGCKSHLRPGLTDRGCKGIAVKERLSLYYLGVRLASVQCFIKDAGRSPAGPPMPNRRRTFISSTVEPFTGGMDNRSLSLQTRKIFEKNCRNLANDVTRNFPTEGYECLDPEFRGIVDSLWKKDRLAKRKLAELDPTLPDDEREAERAAIISNSHNLKASAKLGTGTCVGCEENVMEGKDLCAVHQEESDDRDREVSEGLW
ncbi:UNVERIFIED_CONTAM: hypothetical protein HDU68_003825 [Siphonaria sp. JEL0065]|nr:hypothetical protein HDU68_003825 [Siphonaria sp. JEL0065]